MKIEVKRFEFGSHYTIGKMYIDGEFECYTLEDKYRDSSIPKVKGQTAIPNGTYRVIIDHSTRFNKDMPHILNVPNFSGIRIHSGNTDQDTEGCILVGLTWNGADTIGNSRAAYNHLYDKLAVALESDVAVISIA